MCVNLLSGEGKDDEVSDQNVVIYDVNNDWCDLIPCYFKFSLLMLHLSSVTSSMWLSSCSLGLKKEREEERKKEITCQVCLYFFLYHKTMYENSMAFSND